MLKFKGPVAVSGDWHGDQEFGVDIIRNYSRFTKTFIHVGDFGFFDPTSMSKVSSALQKAGAKLYWIDGNHENHYRINSLERDSEGLAEVHPNMYHVRRGTFIEVDDHTWLLNGGASSVDRKWRTEGFDWWPEERVDLDQIKRVPPTKVSVLVTHETPYRTKAINHLENRPGNYWPEVDVIISEEQTKILSELINSNRPEHVFHGHWHIRYDELVNHGNGIITHYHGLGMNRDLYQNNTVLVNGSGDILS